MKPTEAGDEASPHRPPVTGRAQAAALAAKLATLADRAPAVASDESVAPPQPHGWLWWTFYVLIWTGVAWLALLAALRIFFHDGTYVLTWFNAFTRYLYLPAYPCLVWAVWQRRWVLTAVCTAIVVCHAIWMAPNFLRDRRFDVPPGAATQTSPVLRIFFANVMGTNREYDAMWREISEADPDVVVLAEFSGLWRVALRESPVTERYPYHTGSLWSRFGMIMILSKLPLQNEMQNWAAGRALQTVDIELGSQTLRLIGLHAPRPAYSPEYDYYGFWQQVLPLLAVERRPLVVVGDLNATEHSLVYKRLRGIELRSAHDDRGRGYATTWPNGKFPVPPIRIDQAFLSPEIECERIVEGRGKGSDHKPLVLDVRIREITQP